MPDYLVVTLEPLVDGPLQNTTINFTLNDIDDTIILIHGMITAVLTIIGILVHILSMIILIVEQRKLEQGDVFLIIIVSSNLVVLLFHSATIPITTLTRSWIFGETGCVVTGVIFLFASDIRLNSLIALSIHKYCNVMFPFKYPRISRIIIPVMIIVLLVFSVISHIWYTLTSVIYLDISWPTCDTQAHYHYKTLFTISILVPTIQLIFGGTPFVLYALMWKKAARFKRNLPVLGYYAATTLEISSESIYDTAKNVLLESTIVKEKKALFNLIVLIIAGTPTTFIAYTKKYSDSFDFGFDNLNQLMIFQFVLTYVVFLSPYIDLLIVIMTKDKRKIVRSFIQRCFAGFSCKWFRK